MYNSKEIIHMIHGLSARIASASHGTILTIVTHLRKGKTQKCRDNHACTQLPRSIVPPFLLLLDMVIWIKFCRHGHEPGDCTQSAQNNRPFWGILGLTVRCECQPASASRLDQDAAVQRGPQSGSWHAIVVSDF